MKLLTAEICRKLLANSHKSAIEDHDPKPVLKLFAPWGAATWLLTELDEDGRLFGLCDLGMGSPEIGYVSLAEITALVGPFGLKIERDLHFTAQHTLSEYAEMARESGHIAA